MNYLGLDYGTSHIGVALATGSLSQPLTTLPAKTALASIEELIKKHGIEGIIVGESTLQFITGLKSLGLPVFQIDETLTTLDAQASLHHTTQTRRRELEHSVAAALILQSWLDSQGPNR